jgi:hypothetical protein
MLRLIGFSEDAWILQLHKQSSNLTNEVTVNAVIQKNGESPVCFLLLKNGSHGFSDVGGTRNNVDAAFSHDLHFGSCGIVCSADDGAGMTHSATGRRCLSSDKSYHRFAVIVFDPAGSF